VNDMTDAEIVRGVRQGVRMLKAGAVGHGERMKLDGLWVVVSVERSVTQRDDFRPDPRQNQPREVGR
jgi:hypothetical protein